MGIYIGVMSGTSLDGIDVAVVDFQSDGITLLAAETYPFDDTLHKDLHKLINTGRTHLHQLGQIDMALGHAYSRAILQLLAKIQIPTDQIKAIGCHGQTVYHAPDAIYPFSMQIGNGHVIAETTGIPTITDFRQHDIILGGQGAPLVPAFHQAMFQDNEYHRVIVNIGGISNITILPAGNRQAVTGFDTGPGNVLLDQWYQQHHRGQFDTNGQWAQSGDIDQSLLDLFISDPFFRQPVPKSTGREYFNLKWLTQKLLMLNKPVTANSVQRTLLQLTVSTICDAIMQYAAQTDEVFVCGGGAHNATLMQALCDTLPGMSVQSTSVLGLPPDWVEACAFAWLARQFMHRQPGNLPSVTGARKATVLGVLYSSSHAS